MSRTELARLVAVVAGDLDRRGYPQAGVVRQAARALLELNETPAPALRSVAEPTTATCRRCGCDLPPQSKGRPRVWCSDECRRPRVG